MLNREEFHQALRELARQGLARADKALLVEVAKTVWYSQQVPDLGKLPAELRPDAGYLVDRLARFNVLAKGRKLRLLSAVEQYRGPEEQQAHSSECVDPLAVRWGAHSDLTSRMADLLPYQTREYALQHARERSAA